MARLDPTVRTLAGGANFAAFSVLLESGRPMTHVMWVDADDGHVLINTEVHRAKFRAVERDARHGDDLAARRPVHLCGGAWPGRRDGSRARGAGAHRHALAEVPRPGLRRICDCLGARNPAHRAGRAAHPPRRSEPLERPPVASPRGSHLDDELEEDVISDERFDLGSRPRADLPDRGAPLPDEDPLLRLGLDDHRRPHCPLLPLDELDGQRMRHLVPRQVQRLLANDLRDALVERLIGSLVRREEQRTSGSNSTRSSRSSVTPSRTFALTG